VRAVVILVVDVAGFVEELQVRVGGLLEVERARDTRRDGYVEDIAFNECNCPVDKRLIWSDCDCDRLSLRCCDRNE